MTRVRWGIRALLFGLILVGTVGLVAELLLMEHYDSWSQAIPLVVLGLGLAGEAITVYRPTPGRLRTFQTLMGAFVLTGLVGLWLHYRGNAAFELEIAPEVGLRTLIWNALRGAIPTLAPGALVQLGLLGLIWSHGHPALTAGAPTSKEEGV